MSRFFNNPLVENTWGTSTANLPKTVYSAKGVVHNGLFYVLGGNSSTTFTQQKHNQIYDITTNTWSDKADAPAVTADHMVTEYDGKIYYIGGEARNTCYVYDPTTNTWSTKTAMPENKRRACAKAVGGNIYCISGSATTRTAVCYCYNISSDIWTTIANIPTARDYLDAALVNGIIYCVAGVSSAGATAANEAYDPATNTWATKASGNTARQQTVVEQVNGIVYCIGGESSSGANEAYDPATNTWATKQAMSSQRSAQASGVSDGIIYLVGGYLYTVLNKYTPIGTQKSENTLLIDTSNGTNQVELIKADTAQLTLPVKGVGVGDANGYLKSTACAWYNGTAWTDIL